MFGRKKKPAGHGVGGVCEDCRDLEVSRDREYSQAFAKAVMVQYGIEELFRRQVRRGVIV